MSNKSTSQYLTSEHSENDLFTQVKLIEEGLFEPTELELLAGNTDEMLRIAYLKSQNSFAEIKEEPVFVAEVKLKTQIQGQNVSRLSTIESIYHVPESECRNQVIGHTYEKTQPSSRFKVKRRRNYKVDLPQAEWRLFENSYQNSKVLYIPELGTVNDTAIGRTLDQGITIVEHGNLTAIKIPIYSNKKTEIQHEIIYYFEDGKYYKTDLILYDHNQDSKPPISREIVVSPSSYNTTIDNETNTLQGLRYTTKQIIQMNKGLITTFPNPNLGPNIDINQDIQVYIDSEKFLILSGTKNRMKGIGILGNLNIEGLEEVVKLLCEVNPQNQEEMVKSLDTIRLFLSAQTISVNGSTQFSILA